MTESSNRQQYTYLSRRLLQDLFDEWEAYRPSYYEHVEEFDTRGQVRPSEPSRDNLIWIAKTVTDDLGRETGTIDRPKRFVRHTAEFIWGVLPVLLPDDDDQLTKVAWMYSITDTPHGRAFMALCGSVDNYVGYSPRTPAWEGWRPSTDLGMHAIVYHLLKATGAETTPLGKALHFSRKRKDMLEKAYNTSSYVNSMLPSAGFMWGSGRLEVLVQPFVHEKDVILDGTGHRAALVGTPVWAAVPTPKGFQF